jgi:putative PIN family toxin of toxin-antitoxin system
MFSFQVWYPKRIIRAVATQDACASPQIIDEYQEITKEMIAKLQGKIDEDALSLFFQNLEMILPSAHIELCRDPDDDKFLECAKDAGALYICSGDKDLLILEKFEDIQIITAREFCERFLV